MRNLRSLLIGLSVLVLLALFLQAQEADEPVWTGSLGYKGLEIHHGHGTIPPGAAEWNDVLSQNGGTKVTDGLGLYTFLKFSTGTTILYEFSARPVADREGWYEIMLGPYTPTPKQAASWKIDLNSLDTRFLRNYQAPFLVKDGEVIAVEVAENASTGRKLVHYYVVSKGKPFLRINLERHAREAREFRVEDTEIKVSGYDLRRNGASIYRSEGGCGGKYISIAIPDVGEFWFTLTPPPAHAGFEPNALVKGGQISFTHGEDLYEWLSRESIAPGSGLYQLWMRFDSARGGHNGFSVGARSHPPQAR